MEKYERLCVQEIENLSRNTVYCFLKSQNISEHYIKNLKKSQDAILLNGQPTTMRQTVKIGDVLSLLKNPAPSNNIVECEGILNILFEDDDYLIVNKPHNLACIPTRSHLNSNLGGQIAKYLKQEDPNFTLRILNRLDKESAGIIVVAKNVVAYQKAKLEKTYFAICHGNFDRQSFVIDKNILTITNNGINQMKRVVDKQGKPAITHVEVVKQMQNFALLKLILETGRTHQIRVHLSSENHPLVGDNVYGVEDGFNHSFLLLKHISFKHFRTDKQIDIEIPFPDEWNSIIKNP